MENVDATDPRNLIAEGLDQLLKAHGKEEVAKECASWLLGYCQVVKENYMLITFEDCGRVEVVLNESSSGK